MGLAGLHPQPCQAWVMVALHMADSNPYLGATLDERPWLQAVLQLPPFPLSGHCTEGSWLTRQALSSPGPSPRAWGLAE